MRTYPALHRGRFSAVIGLFVSGGASFSTAQVQPATTPPPTIAATRVLETGRRVPADISLICRGEDTFLHFLSPAPAFYRVNLELLARTLFRSVLRAISGATDPDEHHRVVPNFVAGASVGVGPVTTN